MITFLKSDIVTMYTAEHFMSMVSNRQATPALLLLSAFIIGFFQEMYFMCQTARAT